MGCEDYKAGVGIEQDKLFLDLKLGDCITELRKMKDNNTIVDCIVTSPPYYALRDYNHKDQIGMENSVDEYIDNICSVFDLCYEVLADYGCLWVNLGDTYGGSGNGTTKNADKLNYIKNSKQSYVSSIESAQSSKLRGTSLNKSQLMIPHRICIEMLNRGWKCRNTVIWHKPNQMPSSASDRLTQDFEYIFFFVKNDAYYFEQQFDGYTAPMNRWGGVELNPNKDSEWDNGTGQETYRKRNMRPNAKGRNKRTVWSINTKPSVYKHFASYPIELCETPINAGCPKIVCTACGKPAYYQKVKVDEFQRRWGTGNKSSSPYETQSSTQNIYDYHLTKCACNAPFRKGVVLDPFMGTATTGVAAMKLDRSFVGIELNQEYFAIAEKRLNQNVDLFTELF